MAEQTALDTSIFTMWRMTSGGNESRCVVAVSPGGLVAQFRLNGTLLYSQTLSCLDEVIAWAQARGSALAEQGWHVASDDKPVVELPDRFEQPAVIPQTRGLLGRRHSLAH